MSLKLSLSFKQSLAMIPGMRQSLSILSFSHEELDQAIQKELLENPLLETAESPAEREPGLFEQSGFRMYDYLEAGYKKPGRGEGDFPEDRLSEPVSLQSYVLKQAEMSFFPKEIKELLPALISYLNDKAYLDLDIGEMAEKEKIPLCRAKRALRALQSLDPAGVGARDLKERLLIQLRRKKAGEKARLIVQNHLRYIKEKKYRAIAFDLNISLKETIRLCRLIQSLDPDPARNFSSQPTVFIQPDLYIYKQGGEYQAFLKPENSLRFSSARQSLLKKKDRLKPKEREYIQNKIISGRWFMRAIHQRRQTIKALAGCLIGHQADFFDKGPLYLRPLRMRDIADEMGVHISTVSRASQNKYAHTPQGIIPLKSFFQKGLMTKTGGLVSVSSIKEAIRLWVSEEDPGRPFSDGELRKRLYEAFQVQLPKRSVSNYRLSLGLPAAEGRRAAFLSPAP